MEKRSAPFPAINSGFDRAHTINAPARHEGLGNALRSAFDPGSYGLPDDFVRLLKKIDQ